MHEKSWLYLAGGFLAGLVIGTHIGQSLSSTDDQVKETHYVTIPSFTQEKLNE